MEPHERWEDQAHRGKADRAGKSKNVVEDGNGRGENESEEAESDVETDPSGPMLPCVLLEVDRIAKDANKDILGSGMVEDASTDYETRKSDA